MATSYLVGRGYDVRFVNGDWFGWVDVGRPVERAAMGAAAAASKG